MRYFFIVFILLPNFAASDEIIGVYTTTGIYAVKPPTSSTKTVASTLSVGPFHSHRCPYDGTTWQHTSAMFGSETAHKCPKCGRVQWEVHEPRIKPSPFVLVRPTCPNGNCPLQRRH